MDIGTNLFGVGKYLPEDPGIGAERIREAGFASVEPMVLFFSALPEQVRAAGAERIRMGLGKQRNSIWLDTDAPALMKRYREAGLKIVSAQVFGYANGMIPDEKLAEAMVAFGRENDLRCFVVSGKADSPEAAEKRIPSLNTLAVRLKENGMQLVYHNHEMELKDHGGITALDRIMEGCPDVDLELDVGWVQFAGEDPVSWMKKYQSRLILLHLKDISPDACEENKASCYRAVGEGSLPLQEVLQEARNCPIMAHGLIIDQDDANTDYFEESRRGIANIRKCSKESKL